MKLFTKPLIITFEGPDGCGKSTLQQAFLKHIKENYKDDVIGISEPAEEISIKGFNPRQILRDNKVDHISEILIHLLYRRDNVQNIITPAIREGKSVIQDRFLYSTLCYNAFPFKESDPELMNLFMGTIPYVLNDEIPEPITFLLKTPKETRLERLKETGKDLDRYESDEEYQKQVEEAYEFLEANPSVIILDGSKTIEELITIVIENIQGYLKKVESQTQELRDQLESEFEEESNEEETVETEESQETVTPMTREEYIVDTIKACKDFFESQSPDIDYKKHYDLLETVITDRMEEIETENQDYTDPHFNSHVMNETVSIFHYGLGFNKLYGDKLNGTNN